jgi:hypothetical protein
MTRRPLIVVIALVALAAGACTSINPTTTASANGRGPSFVYVALGESGANGIHHGPPDFRSQWAQIFYRSTFGTNGVFYDLSTDGETVAGALSSVLPRALAVHPDLVTVWLSTGDIVAGTVPLLYGYQLKQLVEALRHAGAIVLLANAAPSDVFPAFASCQSEASECDAQGGSIPTPPTLASSVSAYDRVIGAVARQTGADLVNVHSALERAVQGGGVQSVLSPNGSALSESGAAVVADAFDAQLPRRFRQAK